MPRGRFVLNLAAFPLVAQHMMAGRDCESRKDAMWSLGFVNSDVLLSVAMLAGTSNEGLCFALYLTKQTWTPPYCTTKQTMSWKCHICWSTKGGDWAFSGCTKLMLDNLKRTRLARNPSNRDKSIGGFREPSASLTADAGMSQASAHRHEGRVPRI